MEFLRNKWKGSQVQYGACVRFFRRNFKPGGRIFGSWFFSEMREGEKMRGSTREWAEVGKNNVTFK